MLDIKLIRENPNVIRANLEKRRDRDKMPLLDEVIAKDKEWRALLEEANSLKHERNTVARSIAELKKKGEDAQEAISRSGTISKRISEIDVLIDGLRADIDKGLMALPNILHESVPVGEDDQKNVEVRTWGEIRNFDFDIRSHGEIAENAGLADFERARKVAGAGFVYLKGELALLDNALIQYSIMELVKKGYTLVQPPYMMRRDPYEGVVDLEDFENVMYKVEEEDLYMIATSEHPMAAMYMNEIIDADKLPIKLAGVSTNFRKEIGSRGVDTRGLFRMHQFNKVEQFIFCEPEDSWSFHEELLKNAEDLFQALKLPYRVVNVCTGDIGSIAAKKYDMEAWSPRQEKYIEVVSCSNCTDYQARRLNIRAGRVGGDKHSLHTLNSTAIATSRALVTILENYQNEDGTVTVPEVLRPFMGGLEIMGRR